MVFVKLKWSIDPLEEIVVTAVDGNPLVCTQHDLEWCKHLEEILSYRSDSQEIFSPDHESVEQWVCVVPIFPTHGLFHSVKLKWIPFPVPALDITDIDDDKSYGILAEGDGRAVIREMLIFDLMADRRDNILCKSKSHKFAHEMLLAKHLEDKKWRLIEKWCILKTGKCHSCLEPGSTEDFSDLVPNKEKNW